MRDRKRERALSSSLRWHCGGGFCSGSVLVWIGYREFGFLWVCWIFVCFGLYFWFWVCYGVFSIANGFVGFVGGQWSTVLGFVDVVALLVVDGFVGFASGWWLLGLWVLLVIGGQASMVAGFVGFAVLQFFILIGIREREERRLRGGMRERTECM